MLRTGDCIGEFEIRGLLGQGGMGAVYEAHQPSLKRSVALKILPEWFAKDPNAVKRFQREAESAAQIDHPNIVPVHSFERDTNYFFYTMKLVRGVSLAELIAQAYAGRSTDGIKSTVVWNDPAAKESRSIATERTPQSEAEVLSVAPSGEGRRSPTELEQVVEKFRQDRFRFAAHVGKQVARALCFAHQHDRIHRDIKPSNIMVDREGHVYLIDFGLAGAISQSTLSHQCGTPRYMSPEQFDAKDLDGRTDIYSLGATLYELVSGAIPYEADSITSLFRLIRTGELRPLPEIMRDIPDRLAACIHRAMHPEPSDRFQQAEHLADELDQIERETETAPQRSDSRKSPVESGLVSERKRWGWIAATMALLVLFVAAGIGFSLGFWPKSVPRRQAIVGDGARNQGSFQPNENGTRNSPKITGDSLWQQLLDKEPKAAIQDRFARWTLDGVARHVKVESPRGPTLLSLGSVDDVGYTISTRISDLQPADPDGPFFQVGLFIGGHEGRDGAGQRYYSSQTITLARGGRGGPIHLARGLSRQVFRGDGKSGIFQGSLADAPFDLLGQEPTRLPRVGKPPPYLYADWDRMREQRIEISIGKSGLEKVVWNGREISGLVQPKINEQMARSGYIGEYGLCVAYGNVTLSKTRIKIYTEE